MKQLTMFWEKTRSIDDAIELYRTIIKNFEVEHEDEITVLFKKEITWIFAKEFMERIFTSTIKIDELRRKLKFKGFAQLEQSSFNNMTSAKVNADYTARNGYGCYGYMDGW